MSAIAPRQIMGKPSSSVRGDAVRDGCAHDGQEANPASETAPANKLNAATI
jgi:hypothetical protein